MNFLHTFEPSPILISFGPIHIYWYGLFIVLGVLSGIGLTLKLSEYYKIKKDQIIDLAFWLIIGGIIGARIYHIFLELPFYTSHPLNIFKLWQGGLAIHGAIIAGLAITYYFAKQNKMNFWQITSIMAPAMSIAQAIGRWGNYFNQELFGYPTKVPWGILISPRNRPGEFYVSDFFHPTFLYESLGNLLIFIILLSLHIYIIKKITSEEVRILSYKLLTLTYLILYSVLRFINEFIRIDNTPEFFGIRWPQVISLFIIVLSVCYIVKIILPKSKSSKA